MAKSIIVTPHFCYQLLNYCDKTPWTKTRVYFSIQFHITVHCQRKPGQELKLSRRLEAKTMEEKTAASCLLPMAWYTRFLIVPRTIRGSICPQWAGLSHQSSIKKIHRGALLFFLKLCVCVLSTCLNIYVKVRRSECFPLCVLRQGLPLTLAHWG